MGLDLPAMMAALAQRRPIFHSEADFQQSLGWEIQRRHPEALVRAEVRPRRQLHVDLMIILDGVRTAIELKYIPQRFAGVVDDELYELPGQAPRDLARYDIIKDLVRIEQLVTDGLADRGAVIALTSDPGFWRGAGSNGVIDAAFHLTEARVLPTEMDWAAHASSGTTRGRERTLTLLGSYTCTWDTYASVVAASRAAGFRYLLLNVLADLPHQPTSQVPRQEQPQPPGVGTMRSDGRQRSVGARHEILAAARDLATRSADGTFSVLDVVQELARRGSQYQESTIRTHVTSVMCRDAPTNHLVTYDDLQRVERGRYRLKT